MNITGQKLTHMIHAEDLILYGDEGMNLALNTLNQVYSFLKRQETNSHITLKIDGSVSLVAASNYYGKSFVATKGFFNKDPKICYTEEDIEKYYGEIPGLKEKLKIALFYIPMIKIPQNEIWQGDFLFIKNTLKERDINNIHYITFLPNTILYAVPEDSPLYDVIKNSDIGIAWHTRYRGENISFDVKASELTPVEGAYMIDPEIPEFTRDVFSEDEISFIDKTLSDINELSSKIKRQDSNILNLLNQYNNYIIKNESSTSIEGFKEFINSKYQKEIDTRKTDRGKAQVETRKNEILNNIIDEDINNIFKIQSLISSVKEIFINKLDNLSVTKTFVEYNDGRYEQVGQEGYAVSDKEGNVQKYVNRRQFSKNNFSKDIKKGWASERREMQESVNKEDEISTINAFLNRMNLIKVRRDIISINPNNPEYDATALVEPIEDIDRKEAFEEVKNYLSENQYNYSDMILGSRPIISVEIPREDNSILVFRMQFKDKLGIRGRGTIATEAEEILYAKALANYLAVGTSGITDEDMASINKDWKSAIEKGIEVISTVTDPTKEYFVCRGNYSSDPNYESIHPLINRAQKSLAIKNINAWNPSDIYIVTKDNEVLNTFKSQFENLLNSSNSVNDYNYLLEEYLDNQDIIGISLKKTTNPVIERKGYGKIEENPEIIDMQYIVMPLPINNPIGKTASPIVYANSDINSYIINFRVFDKPKFGMPIVEPRPRKSIAMMGKLPTDSYKMLLRSVNINPELFAGSEKIAHLYNEERIQTSLSYIEDINEVDFIFDTNGNKINLNSFNDLLQITDLSNKLQAYNVRVYCAYIAFCELIIRYKQRNELEKLMTTFIKGSSKDLPDSAPYFIVH